MNNSDPLTLAADRRGASLLLSGFIVLSLSAYLGLMMVFDFPDVLRRSVSEILVAFQAEQTAVRGFYYLFAVAHLVFVAAVLVLHRCLRTIDGPWLTVATAGGALYGLAQTAGFLRWPIVVPLIADYIAAPGLGEIQRETALLVLEALHQYAGMAIGENLSFWGLAVWLTGIGFTLMRGKLLSLLTAWCWIAAGVMVGLYTFEQLGGQFAVLSPLLLISHGLMYGLILAIAWSLHRTTDTSRALAPIGIFATVLISLFCAALVVPGLI
ncbi:MAG: DUF4386 family protein [bacterium]|nr:DUF4386 family protein [bacterium]